MEDNSNIIDEKKKNIIYLVGIIIFFVFAIIFVNVNDNSNKDNNLKDEVIKLNKVTDISVLLNNIQNNFECEYTLNYNLDKYVYKVSVQDNKNLISFNNEIYSLLKYNNEYYEISNDELIKSKPSIDFENFNSIKLDLNSIRNLINSSIRHVNLKEENSSLIRYYITLENISKLLNVKIKNNDLDVLVPLNVFYTDNIDRINLNLTNYLDYFDTDNKVIIHDIKFSNINKVNLNYIDDLFKN